MDLMEPLDLYLRRTCYHRKTSYRNMKRIRVLEKLYIYKFGSHHFWWMIHPKKLWNLQKRSKVSMRSKVRGFYGTIRVHTFITTIVSFFAVITRAVAKVISTRCCLYISASLHFAMCSSAHGWLWEVLASCLLAKVKRHFFKLRSRGVIIV